MSTIHQIYCTHCTHGTSALERREGELARRMLGYSARAGSLEARHLRRFYRQIERYVYYYLPRDTPTEEKLRLTATTAPRRLVYHPSTSGLQVAGQVCYRQTDTEGRPGSYFAHVLFREERDGQPPWSQLDCLKLWGARGWVEQDSPNIPFLLSPLASLDQLLGGRRPAIDDDVLLSFLSAPAGGSFDDPAGTIPDRWRRMDAAERCKAFVDAFHGFLEISATRRESLLLVVEPSVAAILFYGIMRLLPPGPIRQGISFSTFEPNADRLATSLAATWFYDPRKTDLRADAYRSRGFAINTCSDRRSEFQRPPGQYAPTVVQRLLDQGWEAVDWTLASLQAAGARRPEDLDGLAAVDRLVPALFDPRQTSFSQDWRRSPMATGYLRQALARELARLGDPRPALEPILGRPAHLLILELIASGPEPPGTRPAAEFLLSSLPGEMIADLLRLAGLPSETKVAVLARYVSMHAELPPGCDGLWSETSRVAGARGDREGPLLPRVLARLDPDTLEKFYKRVAGEHSDAFLVSLLDACRRVHLEINGLTRVVEAMDEQALLSLFRRRGPALFSEYPEDEPALGAKLHEMVGSLPRHVRQFSERLDAILAGRNLLPDEDQSMVTAWAHCRRAILEIGRLQARKSGVLRQPPVEALEGACRQMAEAARRAMPSDRFQDDRQSSHKQSCLRQIGQRLLGGKPLLPTNVWQYSALWQKITWCFDTGKWSTAPLNKMAPKSRPTASRWILISSIAAVFLVVVLGVLATLKRPAGKSSFPAKTFDVQTDTTPQAATPRKAAEPPPRKTPKAAEREEEREAGEPTARERELTEPADEQATGRPAEAELREVVHPDAEQAAGEETRKRLTERAAVDAALATAETEVGAMEARLDKAGESRPAEAEAWEVWAGLFAEQHAGRFFDRKPLTEGEWVFPTDELPAGSEGTDLFLGAGALYFDNAVFRFGTDFAASTPVRRHEIPELATVFGVPSVYVELEVRPGGAALVLGLPHPKIPLEIEARLKERIEQMERNARMLAVQLRAYDSRRATKQEKDEAFEQLVQLTGVRIPAVPPRPFRRDPEYLENPQAYDRALAEYNEAVEAHNRATGSVIPTAKRAVATVGERKEAAEGELHRAEEQLREHHRQALALLTGQCRQISAIVYRAAEEKHPAAPPASPSPHRDQPAVRAGPQPETVAPVEGRFKVDEKPAPRLNPPAVAQIRPAVTMSGGRPLPPWYREEFVTGCVVVAQDKDGFLLRTTELRDIDAEKVTDVFKGTVAARVRFRFFARSGGPFARQTGAVGATGSHRIEPIKAGRQYTIKLELSQEELDWLRLLAGSPGSGEP